MGGVRPFGKAYCWNEIYIIQGAFKGGVLCQFTDI